jgi:hypothetical protein
MYIWGDICENCCCTRCLLSTLISLQKTEHQLESNSATSWTPSPWKPSLYHGALRKVMSFLPTSWLQSCLHESAEWTGEHHTPHMTPLPNPCKPNIALHRLNSLPTKLKNINGEL